MKNFVNKVKDTASGAVGIIGEKVSLGADKIYEILGKAGIDKDVLSDLISGGLLIKSSLIEERVKTAVSETENVSIQSFNILEDGIHLTIKASKSFFRLGVDIVIYIDEIKLNKDEQVIICNVKINKTKGNKILDIVIKPIIETLLSAVVKNNINKVDMVSNVNFDKNEGSVIIDISDVKGIKLLLVSLPIPVLFSAITPIELLVFDNIVHDTKGITIKGRITVPMTSSKQ